MSQGNYGGYTPPNPNNPYANTGSFGQAPPPKKSKAWIWILGIVGGGGILVCGCCGGLSYFAYNTGMTMIAEQTKQEIQGKPVVQEHIGTIESASPDLMAGVEETQKKGGPSRARAISSFTSREARDLETSSAECRKGAASG